MKIRLFTLCFLLIYGTCLAGTVDSLKTVIARQNVAGGSNPAWGGSIAARLTEDGVGSTSSTLTLTSAVISGDRIVILVSSYNAAVTLSSIADDGSNTYTLHEQLTFNTSEHVVVASAPVTTGMSIGAEITLTWNSATATYRGAAAYSIEDTTSLNTSESGTAYSSDPTVSGTTTSANTVCAGLIKARNAGVAYSASAWTIEGSQHSYGGSNVADYFYTTLSSSGATDPDGTLAAADDWGMAWACFD